MVARGENTLLRSTSIGDASTGQCQAGGHKDRHIHSHSSRSCTEREEAENGTRVTHKSAASHLTTPRLRQPYITLLLRSRHETILFANVHNTPVYLHRPFASSSIHPRPSITERARRVQPTPSSRHEVTDLILLYPAGNESIERVAHGKELDAFARGCAAMASTLLLLLLFVRMEFDLMGQGRESMGARESCSRHRNENCLF